MKKSKIWGIVAFTTEQDRVGTCSFSSEELCASHCVHTLTHTLLTCSPCSAPTLFFSSLYDNTISTVYEICSWWSNSILNTCCVKMLVWCSCVDGMESVLLYLPCTDWHGSINQWKKLELRHESGWISVAWNIFPHLGQVPSSWQQWCFLQHSPSL